MPRLPIAQLLRAIPKKAIRGYAQMTTKAPMLTRIGETALVDVLGSAATEQQSLLRQVTDTSNGNTLTNRLSNIIPYLLYAKGGAGLNLIKKTKYGTKLVTPGANLIRKATYASPLLLWQNNVRPITQFSDDTGIIPNTIGDTKLLKRLADRKETFKNIAYELWQAGKDIAKNAITYVPTNELTETGRNIRRLSTIAQATSSDAIKAITKTINKPTTRIERKIGDPQNNITHLLTTKIKPQNRYITRQQTRDKDHQYINLKFTNNYRPYITKQSRISLKSLRPAITTFLRNRSARSLEKNITKLRKENNAVRYMRKAGMNPLADVVYSQIPLTAVDALKNQDKTQSSLFGLLRRLYHGEAIHTKDILNSITSGISGYYGSKYTRAFSKANKTGMLPAAWQYAKAPFSAAAVSNGISYMSDRGEQGLHNLVKPDNKLLDNLSISKTINENGRKTAEAAMPIIDTASAYIRNSTPQQKENLLRYISPEIASHLDNLTNQYNKYKETLNRKLNSGLENIPNSLFQSK